jgi:YD repeat-containing protein
LGYQTSLKDGTTAQAYWTALTRNAELQLTQEQAGNGVATVSSFSVLNGRLTSRAAGAANVVQNVAYTYDLLGKLVARTDGTQA